MGIKTLILFECSFCGDKAEGESISDVPDGAVVVTLPAHKRVRDMKRAAKQYLCPACVKLVFDARGKAIQKEVGPPCKRAV